MRAPQNNNQGCQLLSKIDERIATANRRHARLLNAVRVRVEIGRVCVWMIQQRGEERREGEVIVAGLRARGAGCDTYDACCTESVCYAPVRPPTVGMSGAGIARW